MDLAPCLFRGDWHWNMGGTFKNYRKIRISNGHKANTRGTYRGDTTTNLHKSSSHISLVLTANLESANLAAPGPTTSQIPCQEATKPFLEITQIMTVGRNWTHVRPLGLRIKHFESARCHESNGTTAVPQNYHVKFNIDQKIPGPHRPNNPLNLAIDHISRDANRSPIVSTTENIACGSTCASFEFYNICIAPCCHGHQVDGQI